MDSDPDFVNVAIRIKPVSNTEQHCLRVLSNEPPVLLLVDRSQTFVFDKIFTEEISQETIYNDSVKPFVEYVKQGFNCTVFAYGQSGTGKTYTMGTNDNVSSEEDFGLIPRALNHFFEYNNDDHNEIEISVSFIEIYNEKVFDLLQSDNPQLQVKGLKAQGFSQEKVFNSYEAKHFLKMGNKNRHTAGTNQNLQSSRSHAVFTIYCNVKNKDRQTSAKLNLVDLAGCESVRKTGTFGSTFQEGININRGLLCIGQVMSALSSNANFIPYRQSIITSILQDSLNKQNFVSLIACISPLADDFTETFQTLEFAHRVKKFKSKPEVNEVISQYKSDNPNLFQTRVTTPFKRPPPMQTPRPTKRVKQLGTIAEPNLSSNTADHSHSSSVASSISSTLRSSVGCSDVTQQALSPVIKKYMNAMEASLMDKLELVIKSTIKRPSRGTVLLDVSKAKTDEFGTPSLPWSKIQHEVSKIVKSEIAQLTLAKSVRATSSPIGEQPLENIKKILNYDDSSLSVHLDEDNATDNNEHFKFPKIPLQKNISKKKSTPEFSPIENIPLVPRRSTRLSMRRMSQNISTTLKDFELTFESTYFINQGIKNLERTLSENKENSEEYFEYGNKRMSILLKDRRQVNTKNSNIGARANKKLCILDTPAGKRLLPRNNNDSPCTSHTKGVLKTLNSGALREIQRLHTVGPKSAEQINLFKNLNGNLNKISDLKKIPGWGNKKFERFVNQNLLKKELI
ncbi:unnamed protein product [Psylliodes chrysocephalus]|uniref:Kinesin motor domain-containing protein n=1 Tax=Psylliodes chrysocephalus TaxID=3402493 RepID=A0A9P0DAE8_9CUCU|nr:unnamed protein product [Psylliodes chrysocephala]